MSINKGFDFVNLDLWLCLYAIIIILKWLK